MVEQQSYLSSKPIDVRERLIVALDFDSTQEAQALVESLADTVIFYKLGLQLFMAGGYYELVDWLVDRHKKVFVDLKFFDVPQTVGSAVRQLKGKGATFATVHGQDPMLRAAVAEKGDLKILAVTVLTSLDRSDLNDLGFDCNVEELVLSRAKRALAVGCDGVISSGLEAPKLRSSLGDNFLIVAPGIRPIDNDSDDQKRTVDVEEAFLKGADYIVVGRPIKDHPDPFAAAQDIQNRITTIFSKK
ncbi:MAG: orotidine-5'-phosphate decarboxylase [Thermosynechococcaceae cyanobacterium]